MPAIVAAALIYAQLSKQVSHNHYYILHFMAESLCCPISITAVIQYGMTGPILRQIGCYYKQSKITASYSVLEH